MLIGYQLTINLGTDLGNLLGRHEVGDKECMRNIGAETS